MAEASIFQQLEFEAFRAGVTPRTKQSIDWFRKKAQALSGVTPRGVMGEEPLYKREKPMPGKMSYYFYDPKHKDTLPYYDTFPLVVFVGPAPGGFHGLNLHYLPPVLRAKLLDRLIENLSNTRYDDSTVIDVNYQLLKRASGNKYFRPCFKHYLTNHVKSSFAFVPPPEWEIATFLPVAQFQKASEATVWKDSRKMI
jgi:hypothetical protein